MKHIRLALAVAGTFFAGSGWALDGRAVYVQTCAPCHTSGVSGAPRLGDRLAWESRLRTGRNGLIAAVLKGKGAMPPKGGNANLSDSDVSAAVEYMIGMAQ